MLKKSDYCRIVLIVNRLFAAWSSAGRVVEWLKRRAHDQHGLGSKTIRAILLCPWERHFTALSLLGGLGKQFFKLPSYLC